MVPLRSCSGHGLELHARTVALPDTATARAPVTGSKKEPEPGQEGIPAGGPAASGLRRRRPLAAWRPRAGPRLRPRLRR
eukprot:896414-Lingulodinium_polyedra.AAC.1